MQKRLARLAIGLGILTILVGAIAYLVTPARPGSLDDWAVMLFNLTALLLLNGPDGAVPAHWLFSVARFLAVLTAASGAAFVVLSLYREGADRLKLGYLGWRARNGKARHTVICGLGRVGQQLIEDLRSREKKPVVVIEIDPAHPQIEACRAQGAIVLTGDAREQAVRRLARLHHAERVFLVAGDGAVNLDIAEDIRADLEATPLRRAAGDPLHCYANIFGHTLAQAAEDSLASTDSVRFHVFNTNVNAARQLLRHDEWGLARISSDPMAPIRVPLRRDEVAYYIVFGFGPMGQTVALQMARLAHFPNLKRLRLTVVDRFQNDAAGRQSRLAFLDRHPGFCPADLDLAQHIRSAVDPDGWASRSARPAHEAWRIDNEKAVEYAVNAEFLNMDTGVDAPDLLFQLLRRIQPSQGARPLVAAVVCFDEDRYNFETALRLKSALSVLHHDGVLTRPFPLYVYLPDERGLWALLARQRQDTRFPIYPFGQREAVASYDHITQTELRKMATAIHHYYEKEFGKPPTPFDALSPTLKASNEDAAAHGEMKLDVLGWTHYKLSTEEYLPPAPQFDQEQVELLAQVEHNRWMGERLTAGWRYGERAASGENQRRLTFCDWSYLTHTDERAKDERHVRALVTMYHEIGHAVVPKSTRNRDEPPVVVPASTSIAPAGSS